jgi:hypothetical protein
MLEDSDVQVSVKYVGLEAQHSSTYQGQIKTLAQVTDVTIDHSLHFPVLLVSVR